MSLPKSLAITGGSLAILITTLIVGVIQFTPLLAKTFSKAEPIRHAKVQMIGERISLDEPAIIEVWTSGRNARMDAFINPTDTEPHMSMLLLPDQDKRCIAFHGHYECEGLVEINMESLAEPTGEEFNAVVVVVNDQHYLRWESTAPMNDDLAYYNNIQFSTNNTGYNDAGASIDVNSTDSHEYINRYEGGVYRHSLSIHFLFENIQKTNPEDFDPTSILVQIIQGKKISPVYKLDTHTNELTIVNTTELKQLQDKFYQQQKDRFQQEPNFVNEMLSVVQDQDHIVLQDEILTNLLAKDFFTEQYWVEELQLIQGMPSIEEVDTAEPPANVQVQNLQTTQIQ